MLMLLFCVLLVLGAAVVLHTTSQASTHARKHAKGFPRFSHSRSFSDLLTVVYPPLPPPPQSSTPSPNPHPTHTYALTPTLLPNSEAPWLTVVSWNMHPLTRPSHWISHLTQPSSLDSTATLSLPPYENPPAQQRRGNIRTLASSCTWS